MNLTFQQHQISIRKAEKEKLLGMGSQLAMRGDAKVEELPLLFPLLLLRVQVSIRYAHCEEDAGAANNSNIPATLVVAAAAVRVIPSKSRIFREYI